MLYRIPYVFTVVGKLKGHKNVDPHLFGDWIDVDIPHLSADDAPISLAFDANQFTLGQRREEYRWYEEKNWRLPYEDRRDHFFTPEDLTNLREAEMRVIREQRAPSRTDLIAKVTGQRQYELRDFVASYEGYRCIRRYDPAHMREILHSDKEEVAGRIAMKARDMLFIDDRLWVATSEPCYQVSKTSPGRVDVRSETSSVQSNWSILWNSFFRADRLDDAKDFAAEVAAQVAPGTPVQVPGEIEIYIPEAIRFDDEGENLLRGARQTVDNTFESLRRVPAERVAAWASLRDAIDGCNPNLDHVADCLRRHADLCHENTESWAIADHVLRRWEMRPLPTRLAFG